MLCCGFLFIGKAFLVYYQQLSGLFYKQLQGSILHSQTPALSYIGGTQSHTDWNAHDTGKQLAQQLVPVYQYVLNYPQTAAGRQDRELLEQIILSEGRDENTNYSRSVSADDMESAADSGTQEPDGQAGNGAHQGLAGAAVSGQSTAGAAAAQAAVPVGAEQAEAFAYHTDKVNEVSLERLKDFDTLLSEYYVLDNMTTITPEQLNVEKLLSYDMRLEGSSDSPQILIYHTHSQEAFADSDPSDPATTIVGAGEKLAELLRGYGFSVIHHTGQYDVASRDYAYSNAAPAVEQLLAENPSIEVIIDLHRDGVAEGTHIVTEIGGRRMAQFMFFNGLSRTKARGNIEYLANEHIDENLAFSFQAQLTANEYYPGLARKIYLKGYRYNMHYRGKSLLIELGAQTNTVEEIMNAVEPLAHILKLTLEGRT
ncbi:MAG: stage II sporulation protein P [Lachnospiraceae bacterium]|nr:stage II sporulation protein P [Lachnospiraceae bacterium]